jgi:hypothetical protein
MSVPSIILEQLGGQQFIAMTGCKNFVGDKNKLRMTIPKNMSKANRLEITLINDLYNMRFYKYTAPRLNKTTFQYTDEKIVEVKDYEGVYADMLQVLFTEVTGMYTRLF